MVYEEREFREGEISINGCTVGYESPAVIVGTLVLFCRTWYCIGAGVGISMLAWRFSWLNWAVYSGMVNPQALSCESFTNQGSVVEGMSDQNNQAHLLVNAYYDGEVACALWLPRPEPSR